MPLTPLPPPTTTTTTTTTTIARARIVTDATAGGGARRFVGLTCFDLGYCYHNFLQASRQIYRIRNRNRNC